MSGYLGITFTDFGEDWIEATIPVSEKTKQKMGLFHGGASAVLAEELGSLASNLCIEDHQAELVVGLELNCSHLKGVRQGILTGRVSPYKLGKKTHVWHIEIKDGDGRLINVSRLTTMVIPREK